MIRTKMLTFVPIVTLATVAFSFAADKFVAADGQEAGDSESSFVEHGKTRNVVERGSAWKAGDGWLQGSGTGNYLYGGWLVGEGDFAITARFSLAEMESTAASLVFGGNHFGFDGRGETLFIEGPDLGPTRLLGPSGDHIKPGQPVEAEVIRRGAKLTFRLAGKEILTVPFKTGAVGLVGLRPWRGTMRIYDFAASGNLVEDRDAILNLQLKLQQVTHIDVNSVKIDVNSPPDGLVVHRDLGVLTTPAVKGQVIYKNGDIVWVPRATITPNGDYMVLFPSGRGEWYQGKEMLALRSKDNGHTWSEATVAFDASQSHHGFVPLIPKKGTGPICRNGPEGAAHKLDLSPFSGRIYAFGTQAIPGSVGDRKLGLHENTPIGFRYSDDDGHTWSAVELIEPAGDPEFRGMSCVRMCETQAGTWLIGSHDGIWSMPRDPKHPVATRQYILRSDDRGKTWTLAPGARPNGWFVKGFDRMDEGTVVAFEGGDIVTFVRTAEGHIWETRSMDDGKTWSEPKPTPLVHPDAPPMVFHLADGRTLVALIHNRHDPSSPHFKISDRNEIWATLSKDGGRTWGEPRFVFAGIIEGGLAPYHSCSYVDLFADGPDLHLFLGQLGSQLLHLTFRESDLAGFPTKAELQKRASEDRLAKKITVGGASIHPAAPPRGLVLREKLGLVTAKAVDGQIVHRAQSGKDVYETRAVITPGGDFLLMFPEGKHYGHSKGAKTNDMIAYRSSDKGETWKGPEVAFDIDYNQHGFVPLVPRGAKRIYAFGTQPIPGKWLPEKGLHENAPIGFRWSDDDGNTWSDVKLIEPVNDPGFLGMSVMRMCETDAGTWLIGSHEGDWSKKPLETRQYILRSEDQGKTWAVLPRPRPDGWHVKEFGRMDEGRPISLGGDKVLAMFRTPEGHLWSARSEDDGRTWTDPAPTPLVHPDAPPMLFHLADGKTLVAFHHNRHAQSKYIGLTAKMEGQKDRSELWVSVSTDEGHTWSEPRFVLANALAAKKNIAWYDHQCSYADLIGDGQDLHLFLPHRWERVLHLRIKASDIPNLPTKRQLAAGLDGVSCDPLSCRWSKHGDYDCHDTLGSSSISCPQARDAWRSFSDELETTNDLMTIAPPRKSRRHSVLKGVWGLSTLSRSWSALSAL